MLNGKQWFIKIYSFCVSLKKSSRSLLYLWEITVQCSLLLSLVRWFSFHTITVLTSCILTTITMPERNCLGVSLVVKTNLWILTVSFILPLRRFNFYWFFSNIFTSILSVSVIRLLTINRSTEKITSNNIFARFISLNLITFISDTVIYAHKGHPIQRSHNIEYHTRSISPWLMMWV